MRLINKYPILRFNVDNVLLLFNWLKSHLRYSIIYLLNFGYILVTFWLHFGYNQNVTNLCRAYPTVPQPVGVQDHFSQNVLKFGFGGGKNVYMKKGAIPFFTDVAEFGFVDGKFLCG